jgi:hypothetical protein
VLALLFSSSQALNLRSVPGYEDVSPEAEKVHVLDIAQQPFSNSPLAFPNPPRTAFYAQ